jgi:hypothetical protein
MEVNAKNMVAEANRMKKEAQRMDPGVVAAELPPVPEAPPAPKRGRPAKTKAVADAAD